MTYHSFRYREIPRAKSRFLLFARWLNWNAWDFVLGSDHIVCGVDEAKMITWMGFSQLVQSHAMEYRVEVPTCEYRTEKLETCIANRSLDRVRSETRTTGTDIDGVSNSEALVDEAP